MKFIIYNGYYDLERKERVFVCKYIDNDGFHNFPIHYGHDIYFIERAIKRFM